MSEEPDDDDNACSFADIWPREAAPCLLFPVRGGGTVVQHQDVMETEWQGTEHFSNTVWEASVWLHSFLQDTSGFFAEAACLVQHHTPVLELGAGTGLAGLTLSLLGVPHVCLTDLEGALPLLRHNVDATFSGLTGDALLQAKKPTVLALPWGKAAAAFQGKFKLILGADIIYCESSHGALLETLRLLLSQTPADSSAAPGPGPDPDPVEASYAEKEPTSPPRRAALQQAPPQQATVQDTAAVCYLCAKERPNRVHEKFIALLEREPSAFRVELLFAPPVRNSNSKSKRRNSSSSSSSCSSGRGNGKGSGGARRTSSTDSSTDGVNVVAEGGAAVDAAFAQEVASLGPMYLYRVTAATVRV